MRKFIIIFAMKEVNIKLSYKNCMNVLGTLIIKKKKYITNTQSTKKYNTIHTTT